MRVFREVSNNVSGFWFEVEPGRLIYAWDEEEAKELINNGAHPTPRAYIEREYSCLSEKH
jgi:hypothetical protein